MDRQNQRNKIKIKNKHNHDAIVISPLKKMTPKYIYTQKIKLISENLHFNTKQISKLGLYSEKRQTQTVYQSSTVYQKLAIFCWDILNCCQCLQYHIGYTAYVIAYTTCSIID